MSELKMMRVLRFASPLALLFVTAGMTGCATAPESDLESETETETEEVATAEQAWGSTDPGLNSHGEFSYEAATEENRNASNAGRPRLWEITNKTDFKTQIKKTAAQLAACEAIALGTAYVNIPAGLVVAVVCAIYSEETFRTAYFGPLAIGSHAPDSCMKQEDLSQRIYYGISTGEEVSQCEWTRDQAAAIIGTGGGDFMRHRQQSGWKACNRTAADVPQLLHSAAEGYRSNVYNKDQLNLVVGYALHQVQDSFCPFHMTRSAADVRRITDSCASDAANAIPGGCTHDRNLEAYEELWNAHPAQADAAANVSYQLLHAVHENLSGLPNDSYVAAVMKEWVNCSPLAIQDWVRAQSPTATLKGEGPTLDGDGWFGMVSGGSASGLLLWNPNVVESTAPTNKLMVKMDTDGLLEAVPRLIPDGPLLRAWRDSGSEIGSFGYPVSDASCNETGCIQEFVNKSGQHQALFVARKTVDLSTIAVGATASLRLNDRVQVRKPNGAWADVAADSNYCTSDFRTSSHRLGVDAQVGNFWAGGHLELADRAYVHGLLTTDCRVEWGNGSGRDNYSVASLTPLTIPTVAVTAPTVLRNEPDVNGGIRELPADKNGSYIPNLRIQNGATVTLGCGAPWHIGSLYVSDGSMLKLDTSCGPQRVYIYGGMTIHGEVRDTDAAVLGDILFYSPTEAITLYADGPSLMGATIVAPNGQVVVDTTGKMYWGALYGRGVEVHQDTKVTHYPFNYKWTPNGL